VFIAKNKYTHFAQSIWLTIILC